MNGYVAFYKGKRIELEARSQYAAAIAAAKEFGVKAKPWLVAVMLAEKNGKVVEHSGSEL